VRQIALPTLNIFLPTKDVLAHPAGYNLHSNPVCAWYGYHRAQRTQTGANL